VVNNVNNDGKLAGVGTVVNKDDTSNFDKAGEDLITAIAEEEESG
jgi:hypothetical protein